MKTKAFAIALLFGATAAVAQIDVVPESQAWDGDDALTTAFETEGANGGGINPVLAAAPAPAGSGPAAIQPSNANPERDARGIAVISAAAVAPAGWNGVPASAMGGPELDPVTGEAAAPDSYPACTATVTDRCLQTYERGRR